MAKRAEAANEKKTPAFTKEQILRSRRYRPRRDALSFLLRDGEAYTQAQIDGLLDTYMKGQVK